MMHLIQGVHGNDLGKQRYIGNSESQTNENYQIAPIAIQVLGSCASICHCISDPLSHQDIFRCLLLTHTESCTLSMIKLSLRARSIENHSDQVLRSGRPSIDKQEVP